MRQLILALIATCILGACATVDTPTAPREDREVITGSNIPRKDRSGSGVTVLSPEALKELQQRGGAAAPPSN